MTTILTCLLLATAALAADPAADGLAIAVEMRRRDAGFGDTIADATMELTDRGGDVVLRRFRYAIREGAEDADRSLLVFSEPRDIAGTALLAHAHADRDEDLWLHLPDLHRTKRIAARGRAGPFVGSEFAYEDLVPWTVQRWTYRRLADEAQDGRPCQVLEMRPRSPSSGYLRQVAWIDSERWQPARIDAYDLQDRPLKTLLLEDWRRYEDRFWRPHRLRMRNLQTGASTTLVFAPLAFHTGLTAADLAAEALGRADR